MKYAFISFTGSSFSIAKRLLDEGNEVLVGQVRDAADLRTKGWQSVGESPEHRRRRLSIYDGILKKIDADYLIDKLKQIAARGEQDQYFVILEHNNLCRYGEIISKLGFKGLLPNWEDYEREKDRKGAHEFVKTYYRHLNLLPSESFTKVKDGVEYVNACENLLVLKSNGNFGDTVVPSTSNVELNHMQIIGALEADAAAYEKGGFLLETKIAKPIEFAPVLAFWDGKPVYSHVEFECKHICAGDIGHDIGGALNLCLEIDLDNAAFLEEFFPPIVYEMAKARPGLFLFDAGVLYDPKTRRCYFTEFAGNRWGWGGIFSEMTMAWRDGEVPTPYFEALSQGKSPLRFKFGATVGMYCVKPDSRFPGLIKEGQPLYCTADVDRQRLYLEHVLRDKDGVWRNVGVKAENNGDLLGFASGYGNTFAGAVERAYEIVDKISFEGMIYRCREDFYSASYSSSIVNRLRFFNEHYLGGVLDNVIGFE